MFREDKIEEMIGKTFTSVKNVDDTLLVFEGDSFSCEFYHAQDCCEDVRIVDIIGDLDDLIGSPVVRAEERTGDTPSDIELSPYDSYTWTFYEFATNKGSVTVRWLGESNGYYSEEVDFKITKGV